VRVSGPEPSPPFTSESAFRQAFIAGLRRLAASEQPSALLLALGNVVAAPEACGELRHELAARLETCRASLPAWRSAPAAETGSDARLLARAVAVGAHQRAAAEERRVGPWRARLSPLRALRPRRMAERPALGLAVPFDEEGFHFDRPGLEPERFACASLGGSEVTLLYNKFPLGPLNSLLVPAIEQHQPQLLTPRLGEWAWAAAAELGSRLPGALLGYNSLGAYASVNHLHLQLLLEPNGLPILHPRWEHEGAGGSDRYPLPVTRLSSARELGSWLEETHEHGQAHNLLLAPGRAYGIRRRQQGTVPVAPWTTGLAFLELAGLVLLDDEAAYRTLGAQQIEHELGLVAEGS
jgi:hypothetical protein